MKIQIGGGLKPRRMIVTGVLLMALGSIWWQREPIWLWFYFLPLGVTPLPAFDEEKAAGLSVERRAELERELFTEVSLWNTDSRRYNGPDALIQRERRWREMASEGFELAHLTLTAFEPGAMRTHSPLRALRRLNELARQGDAGAMCLISHFVLRLPSWGGMKWTRYREQERFWMLRGADMRHPECLKRVGARVLGGSDGFSHDVRYGMQLLTAALDKGYMSAASSFEGYFEEKGLDDVRNRRLSYCWAYQAASYRFNDADLSLRVYRNEAPIEQREALTRELAQLREWRPEIRECLELTKQLEGG